MWSWFHATLAAAQRLASALRSVVGLLALGVLLVPAWAAAAVMPILSAISPESGIVLSQSNRAWWWINQLGEAYLFDADGRVLQHRSVVAYGERAALRYLALPGGRLLAVHDTHVDLYNDQLRVQQKVDLPAGTRIDASTLKFVVVFGSRIALPLDVGYFMLEFGTASATPHTQFVLSESSGRLQTRLIYALNEHIIQVVGDGPRLNVAVLDSNGEAIAEYRIHLSEVKSCANQLLPTDQGLALVCVRNEPDDLVKIVMGRRGYLQSLQRLPPSAEQSLVMVPAALSDRDANRQPADAMRDGVTAFLMSPWTIAERGAVLLPGYAGVRFLSVRSDGVQHGEYATRAQWEWNYAPPSQVYSSAATDFVRMADGSLSIVQGNKFTGILKALTVVPVFVNTSASGLRLTYLGSPELLLGATVEWLTSAGLTTGRERDGLPLPLQNPVMPVASGFLDKIDQMSLAFGSMRSLMRNIQDPASFMQTVQATARRVASLDSRSQNGTSFGSGLVQVVSSKAKEPTGTRRAGAGGTPFSTVGAPLMEAQIDGRRYLLRDYQNPVFSALLLSAPATVANIAVRQSYVYLLSKNTGVLGWHRRNAQQEVETSGGIPGIYVAVFQLGGEVFAVTVKDEVLQLIGSLAVPLGMVPGLRNIKVEGRTATIIGTKIYQLSADRSGLRSITLASTVADVSITEDGRPVWLEGDEVHTQDGKKKRLAGAQQVFQGGEGGQWVMVLHSDGHASLMNSSLRELAYIYKMNGGLLVMTPEGFFSGDGQFLEWLNVIQVSDTGEFKVFPVHQFFDVFHRPDIVKAKLRGDEDYVQKASQELTIEKALQNPPPKVSLSGLPSQTGNQRISVPYTITQDAGGIAEVRVFHNGKLVQSDGTYIDAPGKAYVPVAAKSDDVARYAQAKAAGRNASIVEGLGGNDANQVGSLRNQLIVRGAPEKKCNPCKGVADIEVIPGEENTITVVAFNRDNTIQSAPASVSVKSTLPKIDAHLWVLAVGINEFKSVSPLINARKDANDFACTYVGKDVLAKFNINCSESGKAQSLFKRQNIHVVEPLFDSQATKGNIQAALERIGRQAKPGDTFIWFVASHGMMDANSLFGIFAHDTQCLNNTCTDIRGHLTSNEILEASKQIKAMNQLMVLDTCHSGGLDSKMSGLYDARMSLLAKNMGLHMYASASATEQALDGKPGTNGTFTAQLLEGIRGAAPKNSEGQITVMTLGAFAKQRTIETTQPKMGAKDPRPAQTPVIQHFGQDAGLVADRGTGVSH